MVKIGYEWAGFHYLDIGVLLLDKGLAKLQFIQKSCGPQILFTQHYS